MPQKQRPIINNKTTVYKAREKTAKEKEIEDYKYKQTMKAKARTERSERVGALKFLIMIMLCVTLFRVVSTPQGQNPIPVTFGEIVSVIRDVPQVNNTFTLFNDLTITANWGSLLNPLRDFINMFTSALSAIVYIFGGIVQLCLYAAWIIKWVLGF